MQACSKSLLFRFAFVFQYLEENFYSGLDLKMRSTHSDSQTLALFYCPFQKKKKKKKKKRRKNHCNFFFSGKKRTLLHFLNEEMEEEDFWAKGNAKNSNDGKIKIHGPKLNKQRHVW